MISMVFQKTSQYFFLCSLIFFNFFQSHTMEIPQQKRQSDSLQEQFNKEQLEQISPDYSKYSLGLPISNLAMVKDQVQSFNDRMKKAGISAEFCQDDNCNIIITVSAQLPYSDNQIQIHQIHMPYKENQSINATGLKSLLRRRFESQIEDHVEKISNTIKTTAKSQYKKSWQKKFHFTILPKVLGKLTDKFSSDLAQSIVNSIPPLFNKNNALSIENELEKIGAGVQKKQEELKAANQLSQEMKTVKKLLDAMPLEQKEEKERIQAEVEEEFCTAFEQQIAA